MAREVGGCLVITRHNESLFQEVAGDSTHADAAGTDEVDCFDILDIHLFTIYEFTIYYLPV